MLAFGILGYILPVYALSHVGVLSGRGGGGEHILETIRLSLRKKLFRHRRFCDYGSGTGSAVGVS